MARAEERACRVVRRFADAHLHAGQWNTAPGSHPATVAARNSITVAHERPTVQSYGTPSPKRIGGTVPTSRPPAQNVSLCRCRQRSWSHRSPAAHRHRSFTHALNRPGAIHDDATPSTGSPACPASPLQCRPTSSAGDLRRPPMTPDSSFRPYRLWCQRGRLALENLNSPDDEFCRHRGRSDYIGPSPTDG